ncbi:MAG: FkbM family methyltransferase [Parachlamydiales bacterium]|nr:FkbM family methyltransferase [Parachlamydiales bacterium]
MFHIFALIIFSQVFAFSYPQRYEGIGIYEEAVGHPLEVVAKFLPENPFIFEAGGHYGEDTLRFAKRWPKGKVFTFEPNPHSFELLQEATRGIENISVFNLAVNNFNGAATLYINYGETGDNPIFEGSSSLLEPSDWQAQYYKGPTAVVPCVVLQDWCEDNGIDHIDFMWLDLEGLELQVLKSSPEILDTVKVIYTETNFQDFRKEMTQYHELKKFLEATGFKMIAHWYAERYQGNAIFVRKEPFEN